MSSKEKNDLNDNRFPIRNHGNQKEVAHIFKCRKKRSVDPES